jgi:uncharacterized protein YndB with AHSA1/START domain/uncharacterized protein YciI
MSMRDKARAVADLTEGTIVATVEIEAPAARIFRALTTGEEITRWWGSPETYQTTEWSGDVRPGGRWHAEGVAADGSKFSVEGEFVEVDPPRKLVQTWKPEWDGGNVTKLTIRLDPIAGGTRLTLWHSGFSGRPDSCRGHGEGWERVLAWLDRHVVAPPPSNAVYFLCRLMPPRPSFVNDMSAEEADVMQRHAAYWQDLLRQNKAVIFGPVADPQGTWGVGIVRASGEDEVNAMRDADPAILSGRGFKYEILPMLRAVLRE